jgi:hypothetical protein
MSEQLLDDAQVSPVLEQMRGETVPQHVRRHVSCNAGAARAPRDPQPEC